MSDRHRKATRTGPGRRLVAAIGLLSLGLGACGVYGEPLRARPDDLPAASAAPDSVDAEECPEEDE